MAFASDTTVSTPTTFGKTSAPLALEAKSLASAIEKQKWVPKVLMGDSNSRGGANTMTLIEMMGVKDAKDLSLDMKIK